MASPKLSINIPGVISNVVVVRSKDAFNNGDQPDPVMVNKMLAEGIRKLSGTESTADAWKHIFDNRAVIGLKTNCLAGKQMSTRPELVHSIVSNLIHSGVRKDNIIIWERSSRELAKAGYTINTRGRDVRCFGTDEIGYDNELTSFGEICSLFSRMVTQLCDFLINVPVLKDHNLAGLSGGMKNYYGAIHNPNKYHDNNCNPYVADVNSVPYIRNKNRLIIVDALKVQCNAGPAFYPDWAVKYGGIILGTDPVAVDTVALEILEQLRRGFKLPTLAEDKRAPHYLKSAADPAHGLGNYQPDKIKTHNIDVI